MPTSKGTAAYLRGGGDGIGGPSVDFFVRVDSEGTERARVTLHGELDLEVAPQLREALIELLQNGARMIEVNLAELTFVDSVGLGVLVGGWQRARDHGGDLVVTEPTPSVRRLLEITGLDKVLRVDPST